MYTIDQLRKLKNPSVTLHTKEQFDKLESLGFKMPSKFYGAYSYLIAEGMYDSMSPPRSPYTGNGKYTVLDYSEIYFEEQFIPLIFN